MQNLAIIIKDISLVHTAYNGLNIPADDDLSRAVILIFIYHLNHGNIKNKLFGTKLERFLKSASGRIIDYYNKKIQCPPKTSGHDKRGMGCNCDAC